MIVVACGASDYAQRIARKFPWAKVIHRATRETVPDLRRHSSSDLRSRMSAEGPAAAGRLTWEEAARQMMAVIGKVAPS